MAAISTGAKAPAFALKDKDARTWRLGDFKRDYVVVYFYPKDDTPGCTIEAKEFSDALSTMRRAGVDVVGISGGDERSKQKFCTKYDLKLPLLSDPDFAVAQRYGVYGQKMFMGRTFLGLHRTTFVLGPDRRVIAVFEKVKPKGHAEQVLAVVREHKKR